ncbi:helix-turn-helix transcriptional regulator, partial [Nocardioides sp. GCM10030258]
PVRFERDRAALVFPADMLAMSLPDANPHVRQMGLDYLSARFGDGGQDVRSQVRGYLERILGNGSTDVASVGEALGLHGRTLQRRLAAAGTTYGDVLDGVRRDAALRHLAHSDLPLAQVAAALGLADQSTLTRYVVRWFGKPPSRLRREGVSRSVKKASR